MARPPTAQPVHHMRCLQLSDMGYSLRKIAGALSVEYPKVFDTAPSPDSVSTWIRKGREAWEAEYGPGTDSDLLDAAKVRPQVVRRAMMFMAELDQIRRTGSRKELELLVEQITMHTMLEKLLGNVVGTAAPKVMRHQLEQMTPAVHDRTAAAVQAITPAPLPRRRAAP